MIEASIFRLGTVLDALKQGQNLKLGAYELAELRAALLSYGRAGLDSGSLDFRSEFSAIVDATNWLSNAIGNLEIASPVSRDVGIGYTERAIAALVGAMRGSTLVN